MSLKEERGYIPGRARLYLCNENRGHCVSLLQSTACTATLGPKIKLVKAPCVSSSLSHTQLFKFPALLFVFSVLQGNKELVNDQLNNSIYTVEVFLYL